MELQDSEISRAMLHSNWRDLIRPKRLEVDEKSLTPTYGKFVCEPLERGFGIDARQLAAAHAAVVAAGRGDHRGAHRRRAARVLDDPRRDARTSPTSS